MRFAGIRQQSGENPKNVEEIAYGMSDSGQLSPPTDGLKF